LTVPHRLESLLGYQLRRASSVLMASLAERLAELGLRTAEASVLVVLEAEPLLTQADIGRRLAIKRANMAPLMAGLSARGLVHRTQGEGPARPLKLSKAGMALAAEARRQMEEHEAEYFGQYALEDRDRLSAMLTALWRDSQV
jgi:DNA-binding MarR family transcriptional regulator